MGKEKGGFLSPKQIANRIKAKGLQKLRWYCQMCQKQCRDENGFKCHTMSESHQRQLLLVADDPDKFVDEFSKDFSDDFLETLRLKCGTKRIQANNVYQDYIANKGHIHMNSTQWETLTDFVKWLGREGKCVVDETEKGWFIQLIDRKPESIQRQEALQKKMKMDLDDEERNRRMLEQQIERAKKETVETETVFTELQRQSEDEKVAFRLGGARPKDAPIAPSNILTKPTSSGKGRDEKEKPDASSKSDSKKRKASALEEIIEMEKKQKEKVKKPRRDDWLHEGIVVKVVSKQLGSEYHHQKAVVQDLIGHYQANVKMLDSDDVIKVDQAQLQTVLPALGKTVMMVNGYYRGERAKLEAIDEKSFSCSVLLQSGSEKGKVVHNIVYEDVCKVA